MVQERHKGRMIKSAKGGGGQEGTCFDERKNVRLKLKRRKRVMKKIVMLVLVSVMAFSAAATAGAEWQIYGYQWDRYEMGWEGTDLNEPSAGYYSGFYIPRTYLRFKTKDKSMGYEAALTLDINNQEYGQLVKPGAGEGKIDWGIWVKYGYVDLTKLPLLKDIDAKLRIGMQKVYFGMVDLWGYPVIRKALADQMKMVSSASQGIGVVGGIPGGLGTYELALHNGAYKGGYKYVDGNAEKSLNGSVMLVPVAGVTLRGSAVRELTNSMYSPAKTYAAWAAVLGLTSGPVELWLEYVHSQSADSGADDGVLASSAEGFMAYLALNEIFDRTSFQLRYDEEDPDLSAGSDDTKRVFVAGVNYKAADQVLLQLNLEHHQDKLGGQGIEHDTKVIAQVKWGWKKKIK